MEQSRRTSPLLKLPPEILQKILKYVVGGRLIHIGYISAASLLTTYVIDDASKRGILHASLCQSTQSEEESCKQMQSGISTDCQPTCWQQRHRDCVRIIVRRGFTDPPKSRIRPGNPINLEVMGTCRQLYEECNILLWGTNTFSFVRSFTNVMGRS